MRILDGKKPPLFYDLVRHVEKILPLRYTDPEPYVPYSELWLARRRAQRLSFAVWPMIRDQNVDLQSVLEAASTGDRLRLALLRLRELREKTKGR